jgi:putative membrane protein insertion efficiency factor
MTSWSHLPRVLLIGLVRGYRLLLSPWVGRSCRFAPTCSAYAIEALQKHGALAGTGLAAWRVLRCNPLCEGGCDPVPDNMPWQRRVASPSPHSAAGLFTGLLPSESGAVPTVANLAPAADDESNLSKTTS